MTPPPEHSRPGDETLLVGYVREALHRQEAGEAIDLEQLCAAHPHLAEEVRQTLDLDEGLGDLHGSAQDHDPRLGRRLAGRYRVDARLGMGAMGMVYQARDEELGRDVAVKLLDSQLFLSDSAEARFKREAEILASLRHEHVVPVYDRGRDADGTHFLVMERLSGASLADLVHARCELDAQGPGGRKTAEGTAWVQDLLDGSPAPEEGFLRLSLRWIAELAEGLHAAHQAGVIHRDIKPSNIFIRPDQRAVLLDFGIAARPEDQKLTLGDSVMGTPWYMAPEQAGSGVELRPSLDVYGLCATLYHLLCLRPPYEGDHAQVLLALQTRDPVPAQRIRPELPRDVCAILEKGMAHRPADRYPDMQGLAADLRAFLAHRPVTARPLHPIVRAWRRSRRAPAKSLAWVSSIAAVLLVSIALPLWWSQTAAARGKETTELQRRLPSLIAVEGHPRLRLVADLRPERAARIAALDRILELDPADLPVRLWRAALHLDQGETTAAAADLEHLATQEQSPYLKAVAERYLAAQEAGTEAVDLSELPSPSTAREKYVAGFHELRNRHLTGFAARAEQLLGAAMESYLPARDLRLIALLALGDRARTRAEQTAYFDAARSEALTLEGIYGAPTARTAATRGAALLGLGRYADAIAPLQQSLELRPGRHGPLHNLGVAYRRLGQLAKAEQYLLAAQKVRPDYSNTQYTLAQLHRDRGDFEGAIATVRAIPIEGPGGMGWKQPYLWGDILNIQAHSLRISTGDNTQSKALANQAITKLNEALKLARHPRDRTRVKLTRSISRALASTRLASAIPDQLKLLAADPGNPVAITHLATMLEGSRLSADDTALLRAYLLRLAKNLSQRDPNWQHRVEAESRRPSLRLPR